MRFLKYQMLILWLGLIAPLFAGSLLNIGNSPELFVDQEQIAEMNGVTLELQHPVLKEVVMSYDLPHEGNVSCYTTIFHDGEKYRMYYNGAHYTRFGFIGSARKQHPEFTCYAESQDGITWTRPVIGEVEYEGSKENNILPVPGRWTHCFTPFLDTNPRCPPAEKFKAVAFDHGTPGKLFGFTSADGIHWKQLPKPIITDGNFDSQNLAFYDQERQCYVAYVRKSPTKMRGIAVATSKDFRNWTKLEMLKYNDSNAEYNFYTNAILRYPRSPRFLLGFPMIFNDNRLYPGNWGVGCGDGGFLAGRDGKNFTYYEVAFLRPGHNRERWYNRCNYAAWGMVMTPAEDSTAPQEISLYYSEGYSEGREVKLRRATLRQDGFVSVHAGANKGTLLTKPFTFTATPEDQVKPRPEESAFLPINIDRNPPVKHFGTYCARLSRPSAMEIPETAELGRNATFSIHTDVLSRGGERRFFSAHNKQGGAGKFCFHIYLAPNPAHYKYSLVRVDYSSVGRAEFGGVEFEKKIAQRKDHHFAATYDNGQLKLYMDGELVAVNQMPNPKPLPLSFTLGNLRFANDYPPNGPMNSPFIGYADDLLVLKRTLNADEVAKLAKEGAAAVVNREEDEGVLYTFEDPNNPWQDQLPKDGLQNAYHPSVIPCGKTMLILNLSTGASQGGVRVEILNPETGKPYPGFAMNDCDVIFDDSVNRPVSWKNKAELSSLAGKTIQLRFELQDADLFSYRFGQP